MFFIFSAVLLQWVSRTKLIGTGMANCHVDVVRINTSFWFFLLWQVTLVDKVEISLYVLSSGSEFQLKEEKYQKKNFSQITK